MPRHAKHQDVSDDATRMFVASAYHAGSFKQRPASRPVDQITVPYPRPFRTSPLPHQHTINTQHKMPPPPEENKQASAQVAVDLLWEISQILVSKPAGPKSATVCRTICDRVLTARPPPIQNCHLDRREISICTSLIERGVNPEALAVSLPLVVPSFPCNVCPLAGVRIAHCDRECRPPSRSCARAPRRPRLSLSRVSSSNNNSSNSSNDSACASEGSWEFGVFVTRLSVDLVITCLGEAWADTRFSGSTRGLRINYLLCEYLCTACAINSI